MDRAALGRAPLLLRAWAYLGAALFASALALGASSVRAEEGSPSRAEYVERVEPICKQGSEANERILEGARDKVKAGRLPVAGRQFIHASDAFAKTIERIVAVPRPPSDAPRLTRWFGILRVVKESLRQVGVAFEEENKVRANHSAIRAERSGNVANNASFIFEFRYCRFEASRLT